MYIPIPIISRHLKKAEHFFSKYDLVSIIGDADQKTFLGGQESISCRFCKKLPADTDFKKDAHVIPEFMGNHNLLSKFECDECNARFSKFEDSFANFLGISRTSGQIRGKKHRIPKYKENATGLRMEVEDHAMVISYLKDSGSVMINEELKTITVNTIRPSHIPIHIPKLFTKIGLSLLDEAEMDSFDRTLDFLLDDDAEMKHHNDLTIFGYFIPGIPPYPSPFVQLFKRKSLLDIPKYQLMIYYSGYQLQMSLPFCREYMHLKGKTIQLPMAPLFLEDEHLDRFGHEQAFSWDFNSNKKKVGEEHTQVFSFNSIDKETNKQTLVPIKIQGE